MKWYHVLAILIFTFFVLQCDPKQNTPDSRTADENAIRKADMEWSAEAEKLEGHLSYFLDDAIIMASNEPIISGKKAIAEVLEEMHSMPGFSVKWNPTKIEVAGSGELGYSIGAYTLTMNDSLGVKNTDTGKYLTIWKKQADGSWKVAADSFNSDLPM